MFSADKVDSDDWDSDADEQHNISMENNTTQENNKNDKGRMSENHDEDR